MEQSPTISAVIPCYNAGPFLRETLDSVLSQTFRPCEVIVVDDGSTDDSAAIAEEYGPAVTLVRQPNQGESVARNRGMEIAKGDWVAFLDADDVWVPNKLARQVEIIRQDADLVCLMSKVYWFGSKTGMPANDIYEQERDLPLVERIILFPIIHPSSAVVRRDCGVRFPEWTQYAEDVIFFAELACKGRFYFTDAPLIGYRRHDSAQLNRPIFLGSLFWHVHSRLKWVEEQKGCLTGPQRDRLGARLMAFFIREAHCARYTRQWAKYWAIRDLLTRSAFSRHAASVVNERIYPRIVYWLKDLYDDGLRWLIRKRRQAAMPSGNGANTAHDK